MEHRFTLAKDSGKFDNKEVNKLNSKKKQENKYEHQKGRRPLEISFKKHKEIKRKIS